MNRNIHVMKEKYLESMKKKNYTDLSLKKCNRDLNFFIQFLNLKYPAILDTGEIKTEMIREYKDYLDSYIKKGNSAFYGKGLKWITKYNFMMSLSNFFRFLEKNEYIFLDPMRNIEIGPKQKELPKDILSVDEVERLLETPDLSSPVGLRDRCMLEFLYGSGIRAGEISKIQMKDLDLEHCYLYVSGKGRKDRIVPITKIARKFVKKYLGKARPFFLLKKPDENALFIKGTGYPYNTNDVGTMLRKYRRRAKLVKRVSPHTLRHTCATHLIAGGASLRYVQELLGHSNIGTTQIYTHVLPVDLQRVYQETHPRCLKLQGKKIEPDEEDN